MKRYTRPGGVARFLLMGLALILLLPLRAGSTSSDAPGLSAASAVLMEAETGAVLLAKDADTRRPMASTTKIMTALVVLETCDPATTVRIPCGAVGVEGSSVYLVENEALTVEQLLQALMLESANDAATALAIVTAGSVEAFAQRMNDKAASLGLADTAFENPHGLDGEGHYTTARDLATLTAYALKNDAFRRIVSTQRAVIPLNGTEGARLLLNHNRLLRSYEGCIGVKTGFTKRSGRCLVSAAQRDGVTLVAVTLKAPDDWNDHRRMLDYGFARLETVTLLGEEGYWGVVPAVGGTSPCFRYAALGPLSVTLPRERGEVVAVCEMSQFYYAPVSEGEVIGRIVWYAGGREIASRPLIAVDPVEKKPVRRSFWQWLLSLFRI